MSENEVKLAERIANILYQLNSNTSVNVRALADEFNVSTKTIQTDLNKRLSIFGIEDDGKGNYWMDRRYQGILTMSDLKNFAVLSGVSEIFPDIDDYFIQDILEHKFKDSFLIKSPFKESTKDKRHEFNIISEAIEKHNHIRISYNDKRYTVEPYKLFNISGLWYVCCVDEGKLKTFRLIKIFKINQLGTTFIPDNSILEIIENSDSIWMGNNEDTTVKLRVVPEFCEYFLERIILPGQVEVIKEEDGSLTVILNVSFIDEIQALVKYWIPRLEVIEPLLLKESIDNELSLYLTK
ncbi:WYL domain-containing protein [Thiospirochaeta perfilievii]|uniref:WYL domain-containing protein n=1 Tax=Thiospirochaeta perfilievii TaxID=252967 RepID=A0A5C1Q7H2_9SPIO|nr:WYL domain-containing protein [Thiospirochaeta perfilievii]QEN03327.1 WYL domain-containing protein [Thiospirochaeta perfilievii]